MKQTLRSLLTLAILATAAASAQDAGKCQSTLHIRNVASALGPEARIQPVFSDKGLKGWRVYGIKSSAQLGAHSIPAGSMMTHVCGVAAGQIFMSDGKICCGGDAAKEFEVTFQIAEQPRKILIRQQP
jgi:hypothetical protein